MTEAQGVALLELMTHVDGLMLTVAVTLCTLAWFVIWIFGVLLAFAGWAIWGAAVGRYARTFADVPVWRKDE